MFRPCITKYIIILLEKECFSFAFDQSEDKENKKIKFNISIYAENYELTNNEGYKVLEYCEQYLPNSCINYIFNLTDSTKFTKKDSENLKNFFLTIYNKCKESFLKNLKKEK